MKINEVKGVFSDKTKAKQRELKLRHMFAQSDLEKYEIDGATKTINIFQNVEWKEMPQWARKVSIYSPDGGWKIGIVEGNFGLADCYRFEGLPEHVTGNCVIGYSASPTYVGLPKIVEGALYIKGWSLRSFKGCHKYFKHLKYLRAEHVQEDVLGLLMIPGFTHCDLKDAEPSRIISIYATKDKTSEGHHIDVHGCQQTLIDKGFAKYARP